MKIFLYIIGAPLFLFSLFAYMGVFFFMRPKVDSDLEEYYFELEEHHPGYARYHKWSRITFSMAAAGALMMFLALAV